MNFIQPQNRTQLTFSSLEDLAAADNPVRLIDALRKKIRIECSVGNQPNSNDKVGNWAMWGREGVFSQPDVFGLGEGGDFHHKC